MKRGMFDVPVGVTSLQIDAYHGVCHAQFLENVSRIFRDGGYRGTHSLHLSMPEVEKLRQAVDVLALRLEDARRTLAVLGQPEGTERVVDVQLRTEASSSR